MIWNPYLQKLKTPANRLAHRHIKTQHYITQTETKKGKEN